MAETIRVSILQMTSTHDHLHNLETILAAIENAEGRILFLPENSLFLNTQNAPFAPKDALSPERPEIKDLQKACRKKGIYLHLGGIAWRSKGVVRNMAVIIDPTGQILESYAKTHLFDLDMEEVQTMESASFAPGNQLATFVVDGFKFATLICYDLRFAELFVHYVVTEKVDAFVVPAAFTAKTGEAHWQLLNRARAVESQSYVIAPAQVGGHWNAEKSWERKSWGQSLVIDPWGRTLVERPNYHNYLDSGHGVEMPITCLLDKAQIAQVRKAMPMAKHRAFTLKLESRWEKSEP